MPTVSAVALIEAFDPGLGNVLLYSFGHGQEVRLLLNRLRPHQAIFVLEPDAAALRASLELGDFSAAIRARRLLVFAGPHAWEQMQHFLVTNPGFLVPQRILARPWFEPALIQNLRERMTKLGEEVSARRSAASGSDRVEGDPGEFIAIVSNRPDDWISRWAGDLAAGAKKLGWQTKRFVLDDPATVEPAVADRMLRAGICRAVLVIGVAPKALPYRLPAAPCGVFMLPMEPRPEWIGEIPESCWIVTPHEPEPSFKKVFSLAMAVPDWCAEMAPLAIGSKIGIVADFINRSAESAGLTLASHQHLWNAAVQILTERVDRSESAGLDTTPATLLCDAEKRLDIELHSPEVRTGLEQRFEHLLLPAMFQDALIRAVRRSDRHAVLLGRGWPINESVESRTWSPSDSSTWEDIGTVFFPQRNWMSEQNALIAASLGLPVSLLGSLPAEEPLSLLQSFSTPGEAIKLLKRGISNLTTECRAVREALTKRHTESARLNSLLAAMGVSH